MWCSHTESGGPVFSARADLAAPDAEKEKFGSLLIFQGESIEEVRKIVEADPFYTGGVVSPCYRESPNGDC